jgi:hypothetical protein
MEEKMDIMNDKEGRWVMKKIAEELLLYRFGMENSIQNIRKLSAHLILFERNMNDNKCKKNSY